MSSGKFTDRDAMRIPSGQRAGRGTISFRRVSAHASDEQTSLSEFAQVVAHRIGGLVSSIEGFTDLLIDGIEQEDDRETAFRILESVSRIEAILHDLKHYDDEIDMRARRISVRKLVSGVFNVLADSEVERVRLRTEAVDDVYVDIDERLVRQAMLSVIRNGLEAAPADSPLEITVSVNRSERSVNFSLSNQGPIPDSADSDRLFDAFYTTKAHNLGLGLTMARRFVRLHGGDVTLSSASDEKQTEFVVSLPAFHEHDEPGIGASDRNASAPRSGG